MDTRTAEPDIDRRERLEAEAEDVVDLAVDAVERAWEDGDGPAGDRSRRRTLATAVLRAVLVDFVQSGLDVDRREALTVQVADVAPTTDVREFLRTVRVVGLDVLVAQLEDAAALTRAEHLRLRAAAERVSGLTVGDDVIETPGGIEVLRRLQGTGVDLR